MREEAPAQSPPRPGGRRPRSCEHQRGTQKKEKKRKQRKNSRKQALFIRTFHIWSFQILPLQVSLKRVKQAASASEMTLALPGTPRAPRPDGPRCGGRHVSHTEPLFTDSTSLFRIAGSRSPRRRDRDDDYFFNKKASLTPLGLP